MKIKYLNHKTNLKTTGNWFRKRRAKPLIELIMKVYIEKGTVRVLDVGGREEYWQALDIDFLLKKCAKITILNLSSDIKERESKLFEYVVGDACKLSGYVNNSFDIVHSNSVIEHVGNWEKIKEFASETRRIAPNVFIQTPYFWFPVEPHFMKLAHHWLPKSCRATIWMKYSMGERRKAKDINDAMNKLDNEPYLLDIRMFRFLFPDCKIIRERFLLFTKSLIAYRCVCNSLYER